MARGGYGNQAIGRMANSAKPVIATGRYVVMSYDGKVYGSYESQADAEAARAAMGKPSLQIYALAK